MQFQTILHPTDFSGPSEYALKLACSLARDHDARLILLHVWSPPLVPNVLGPAPVRPEDFSPEPYEQQLHDLHLPMPVLRVDRRLEQGDAATEIIRVAEQTGCDLIVIGTHGRTGLDRVVMGSVAEEVLRNAPCPVLAAKTPRQNKAPVMMPLAHEAAGRR